MTPLPRDDAASQLCRLCQLNPPIKHSHIFSEFLWKKSGLAHRSDSEGYRFINRDQPKSHSKLQRAGITEPLLCKSCEEKRSKIEVYMSKVLYGSSGADGIVRAKSNGHQIIENLSYEKVKLFTMYNLFMMGVSRHPFYQGAQIEENHTERLRQMLLKADPGEPWRYSSIWFRLKVENEVLEGISRGPSPTKWRDSEQIVYRTVMAGISWMTFCSAYPHPSLEEPLFIGPSGRLVLFEAKPEHLPFVANQIGEYFESQGHSTVYNRRR